MHEYVNYARPPLSFRFVDLRALDDSGKRIYSRDEYTRGEGKLFSRVETALVYPLSYLFESGPSRGRFPTKECPSVFMSRATPLSFVPMTARRGPCLDSPPDKRDTYRKHTYNAYPKRCRSP